MQIWRFEKEIYWFVFFKDDLLLFFHTHAIDWIIIINIIITHTTESHPL